MKHVEMIINIMEDVILLIEVAVDLDLSTIEEDLLKVMIVDTTPDKIVLRIRDEGKTQVKGMEGIQLTTMDGVNAMSTMIVSTGTGIMREREEKLTVEAEVMKIDGGADTHL